MSGASGSYPIPAELTESDGASAVGRLVRGHPAMHPRSSGLPSRHDHRRGFEKILVPLDGSLAAESVLRPIQRLLRNCERVTLFRVVGKAEGAAARTSAQGYLHDLQAFLIAHGVPARTHLAMGIPEQAILRYMNEEPTDLVTMTSHGRGVSAENWGGVTQKVVAAAQVPVFVVRSLAPIPRYIVAFADESSDPNDMLSHVEELSLGWEHETRLVQIVSGQPQRSARTRPRGQTNSVVVESIPATHISEILRAARAADLVVVGKVDSTNRDFAPHLLQGCRGFFLVLPT